MAPLPAIVQSSWKAHVEYMKTTPRYQEHVAAELTTTIRKQTVKYRQIQLDKNSATYAQISNADNKGQSLDALTSLKYTVETRGSPPADGYPLFLAMHGGGGGPSKDNDEEWQNMMGFYRGSISQGIYIALRGIGDTWNLHFTASSYVLIEKLIENFILFGNVNPDQVYLVGFSAGGDGVYRLAPRLAQRFTAVNAGGGHPGGAYFENLANLPMCMQVGEYDSAYDRCYKVAEAATKIDALKDKYPNEAIYQKDLFIHPPFDDEQFDFSDPWQDYIGRHWQWESYYANMTATEYPDRKWHPVVKDYRNWFTNYYNDGVPDQNVGYADTSAIGWMTSHRGNRPTPQRVIWDLRERIDDDSFSSAVFSNTAGRGADGKGRSQNYWLDIAQHTRTDVGDRIEASIDKNTNTVNVVSAKKYLRILLVPDMLANPTQNITVKVAGQTLTATVRWDDPSVIKDTLLRNDPRYVFTGQIVIMQGADSGGRWLVAAQA